MSSGKERGLLDDLLKMQYQFRCLIFTTREAERYEITLDVVQKRTGEIKCLVNRTGKIMLHVTENRTGEIICCREQTW
jgi:hypothetical protein